VEGHHKVNRWDNTELNRLDNTELIDWGLAFLCFLWTVSYLFVYFFQNHARAIGWLQKAVNSCLSLEAHTQNKETIPYAQPGDGNSRPCLVLGQLHSRAQMPHATTRLSSWPTNTHVSVWRELRWGLSPGSPCCGPESSSQPAVIASHRTFSSMVISTTSVRAVQDGSCLGASKKNSQGKKSDLETNRFVISCHAIWFSGKLPALSVAKKSRQIRRVPPSRGAEQGAIRCHTRWKAAQRKGVTHPCTAVEETEHTAREIKQSQNNHFCCNKFIFPCSPPPEFGTAGLAWLGTQQSTWATAAPCQLPALPVHQPWLLQAVAAERARDKERRNAGRDDSSAERCDALPDTSGLLRGPYQQTQVQGQPWCTYWKLTLPASRSQHNFK